MASFSENVLRDVRSALAEDVGAGDLSAALIAPDARARGVLTCREGGIVLCGAAWFEECFRELDAGAVFGWRCREGDEIPEGGEVAEVSGLARALLSGERSALNFLQTLSGTATAARRMLGLTGGRAVLADTRKTLPKLRFAQKHAVRVGGARNHRAGLYDEILLKENHLALSGGGAGGAAGADGSGMIRAALASGIGRERVQVEVRNLAEMESALDAGAVRILLDNFSVEDLRAAVRANGGRAELEASGGADEGNLAEIAATGVDRISSGAMTKNVRAADFSFALTAADF